MKRAVTVMPAMLLAAQVFAASFDLEGWLEKRGMLTHEARRLRSEYKWAEANATSPAEGVVIPLETHPDGSVKTVVSAKRAQIFVKKDLIWAEDVEIRRLNADGTVESVIKAGKSVFDRSDCARSGWVEGEAEIRHATTVFKGKNVYFSSIEEYVMSMEDSQVTSSGLKTEDLK